MAALGPAPKFYEHDSNGDPLSSGKVYTYAAGTDTPLATYTDAGGGTANANPVILDSAGRANIWMTSASSYKFVVKTSADATVYTVDDISASLTQAVLSASSGSSLVGFLQVGTGAVARTVQAKERDIMSVTDFGAVGDGSTNDSAAFALATTAAYAYNAALFIPAVEPNDYYRLESAWAITDRDSLSIYGAGTMSLLCAQNASGLNCITVDSTQHVEIRDIGVTGIIGSGNGIEIKGSSGHARLSNIWIGWVDANGLQITSGVSGIFTNISVDQNNGYDPAGLGNGVRGNINDGIVVAYEASGLTTDQTFIGCQVDAAAGSGASDYAFKVGGSATGAVDDVRWYGGLLQGGADTLLLYIRGNDCVMDGCYYEVTQNALEYPILIDRSRNVVIKNSIVQVDVQLSGACVNCGIEQCTMAGINISDTATLSYVRDVSYKTVTTGPTGGRIIDTSSKADLRGNRNVANERFATGDNSQRGRTYFYTGMNNWVGGGSPTVPCGLEEVGTGTITREATIIHASTYSAKCVFGATSDYLRIIIPASVVGAGVQQVVIEAWVYNLTTSGIARIGMTEGGTANSVYESTNQADTWERVLVSCKPNASATFLVVELGCAMAGTVYWGSLKILLDTFEPPKSLTLGDTGTPDISSGGLSSPEWVTSGTTAVTDFTNPIVGEPFIIRFAHNKTITYNASKILLTGAVDFSGTPTDTLTMYYGADGLFHEIGRSVV